MQSSIDESLKKDQIQYVNNLKNNHMFPRDPIKRSFFDSDEKLWVITTDVDGRETYSSPQTIETLPTYKYSYINKII